MTPTSITLVLALATSAGVAAIGAQSATPAKQSTPSVKAHGNTAQKETADGKLGLKDLPPAVRATVEAETKNATLKGLSKEKEDGKTVYELESLVNGRTRDLMIDATGRVYVVEEQLDADKAPAAVKSALEARGQIVVLESVMTNGKTHYESQVRTKAGKKLTLELDQDGKPIKK
jgi:uncharacterized membrane protein YkoI